MATSKKTTKPQFKAKTTNEHYEDAAKRIIEALKEGTAPWIKPWDSSVSKTFSRPLSASTNKPYSGINTILLMSRGHSDPRWCTFNQAKANGWNIRKGEKGTAIYFFKPHMVKSEEIDPKTGEPKVRTIPVLKSFTVFNAEQMDNVPAFDPTPKDFKPVEAAEAIIAGSGAKIRMGAEEPRYLLATDEIEIPAKAAFASEEAFYSTAIHELGHWSGHPDRLNRPNVEFLDDPVLYAKEELRAEIASMLMAADIGILHDPSNHMAFIGEWIALLENDPKEIFRAARDAEAIKNHLLALAQPSAEVDIARAAQNERTAVEDVSFTSPSDSSIDEGDFMEIFGIAFDSDEAKAHASASHSFG